MNKYALAMLAFLPFQTASYAQETPVPERYPATYVQIIQDAQTEKGVLVYSNISTANWGAFLDLAKKRYPFLKIETTDESSPWEKYFAESGASARSADLILTTAPERWPDFIERGEAAQYLSPEDANLPDWSKIAPGVYTASADPFIIAYNRRAFANTKPPTSIEAVVAAVQKDAKLQKRVTGYDPETAIGLSIWNSWVESKPNRWALIEAIGSSLRPERSAGTMREKVTTGEQAVAIFTSGAGIRQYEQPATKALAGWNYPTDGTPILLRNVAITKAAASPNSAKLFLDLLLSRDGQIAFASGGQTPYRSDIAPGDVPFASYTAVVAAVGEHNVIRVAPSAELAKARDEFMKHWNSALGR